MNTTDRQQGRGTDERRLDFRDHLAAHPGEARAYGRLKKEPARKFSDDRESYTEGRTGSTQDMERKAKAWKGG